MMICTSCKTSMPVDDFNWRNKTKGIRQTCCRVCKAKHQKNWYEKHKAVHCRNVKAHQRKRDTALREQLRVYLTEHPCLDCGETDPMVLTFDHVRGIKRTEVSRLVSDGCSWQAVLDEIAKCEVRCWNCHMRVTFQRKKAKKVY